MRDAGFVLIFLNVGANMHLCLGLGALSAMNIAFCCPGLVVCLLMIHSSGFTL